MREFHSRSCLSFEFFFITFHNINEVSYPVEECWLSAESVNNDFQLL